MGRDMFGSLFVERRKKMRAALLFLILAGINALYALLMTFLISRVALLWNVRFTSKELFLIGLFFFFVMPLVRELKIGEEE